LRDRTFRVLAAEHEQKQAIIREQAAQEVQAARRAASVKIAIAQMKYWEIIADNLSKAGWSWGCVSAVDCDGQTIFIADAASVGGVVPGDQLQMLHKDHLMAL